MVQGGDPNGTGTGGPGCTHSRRVYKKRLQNDLKHDRDVLSMARTAVPNSAGSQFFVMVAPAPHLDGEYAAFGKVTEGIEVVDEIVFAKRDWMDKPLKDQKMKSVSVETFGVDYPEPEKVD